MKSVCVSVFLLVLLVILAQCDARSLKKRSGKAYNSYNPGYKNYDDADDDDVIVIFLFFFFLFKRIISLIFIIFR
jgi:hypothetical protein